MNITFKQLNVFFIVAQTGSITAAADKLFISKPAVSMALAELEKQLDQKLFDRCNNRLSINHQGTTLLPLVDELLNRSLTIENLFNQNNRIIGKLKIGSSNTIGNQITPFLLRDFRVSSGHTDQSTFISNSAIVCQKIRSFEIDIALVEGQVNDADFQVIPWIKDEMVIVCSPLHPLVKKQAVEVTELENSQWILRELGSGTRGFFLEKIAFNFKKWHLAFELNTAEAIINHVSAGLGIACLSRLAVQHALKDGRLSLIKLDPKIEMARQFCLVLNKDKYITPLLKLFIAFCLEWNSEK